MRYIAYGNTDIGSSRTTNEDAFGISEGLNLYIVADGMGGHAAGEVASNLAVQVIEEYMASTRNETEITLPFDIPTDLPLVAQRLVASGKLANQKIFELGQSDKRYTGMGTTVVNLIMDDNKAYITHAGDSRVYLVRFHSIQPITRDHSLVKDYVTQGILRDEDTAIHPLKHVITRALGTGAQVDMEINTVPVQEGDVFLLCSDGLSNPLSDEELLSNVDGTVPNPEEGCQRLIESALRKGADDNITVVLVACLK